MVTGLIEAYSVHFETEPFLARSTTRGSAILETHVLFFAGHRGTVKVKAIVTDVTWSPVRNFREYPRVRSRTACASQSLHEVEVFTVIIKLLQAGAEDCIAQSASR